MTVTILFVAEYELQKGERMRLAVVIDVDGDIM